MHCSHAMPDGQTCKAYAVNGSAYCFQHDPAKAAQRAEARSKGGRARHGREIGSAATREASIIESPVDLTRALIEEFGFIQKLEPSVSRARTLAYLSEKIFRGYEVGELLERISALEQRLADRERE